MRWPCPCSCSPYACILQDPTNTREDSWHDDTAFEGAARAAITDLERGRAITTWLVMTRITLETTHANVGFSSLLRWKPKTRQVTTTTIALHVDHAAPARHTEKREHVRLNSTAKPVPRLWPIGLSYQHTARPLYRVLSHGTDSHSPPS
jgi:hypothetical protein